MSIDVRRPPRKQEERPLKLIPHRNPDPKSRLAPRRVPPFRAVNPDPFRKPEVLRASALRRRLHRES